MLCCALKPCPFCSIAPSRILLKTDQAIAFADAHPISKGHTLVAPRQHVGSIQQLSIVEQKALWGFVGNVRQRLLKDFRLDSFYIGFNDRAAAGQTVAHAHIHVIPRRQGDVPDPRGGIKWVVAESA
jgi:diadenosine tetraphosphate (Ap4A) HIT family hydrolase